ncbi:MAG: thermonuclease family protein [Planctomycetaceae bacterium]|jgi:endonuclease YncB( thermonuclease family)|nr:thermonuclease family protein [Planctomycetaceae bacterium]
MKKIITTIISFAILINLTSIAKGQPDWSELLLRQAEKEAEIIINWETDLIKCQKRAQDNMRRLYYNGTLTKTYRVERVIDGDTIVIGGENGLETVRLLGIDCPELGKDNKSNEPYAVAAKELVEKILAFRKNKVTLMLYNYRQDRYGRTVAIVFAGGYDIQKILSNEYTDTDVLNLMLLLNGMAKYKPGYNFSKFLKDRMDAFQSIAMMKRLGIWSNVTLQPTAESIQVMQNNTVTHHEIRNEYRNLLLTACRKFDKNITYVTDEQVEAYKEIKKSINNNEPIFNAKIKKFKDKLIEDNRKTNFYYRLSDPDDLIPPNDYVINDTETQDKDKELFDFYVDYRKNLKNNLKHPEGLSKKTLEGIQDEVRDTEKIIKEMKIRWLYEEQDEPKAIPIANGRL